MKANDKQPAKHGEDKSPYTVQKAEKDLGKIGQNLDNSMKAASANLHKTIDKANHSNSTAAAKKH